MDSDFPTELFSRVSTSEIQHLLRLSKRLPVQRYRRILARCLDLTPAEIAYRVRVMFGHEHDGGSRRTGLHPPAATSRESVLDALDRRFILSRCAAESVVSALATDSQTAARVREEARLVQTEGARIFDRAALLDPGTIDWQSDPRVGRRLWPQIRMDETAAVHATRDPDGMAISDVKYVWELSRHQPLMALVLTHRIDGDPKPLLHASALLEGWIAQNPAGIGVNWASALEVGVRSLSWLWMMAFVLDSRHLAPAQAALWIGSLGDHYEFLRGHLSVYTDRSNHLIGEATALWMLASVFRDFPDADVEAARALGILCAEAERQITVDGVSCEQATGYHCFVLDFYLQVAALARRQQLPLQAVLESRVVAMLDFLARLAGVGGALPQIGDGDDGRGFPFACPVTTRERTETLLALGADLFARPEWSPASSVPRTLARLLGGADDSAPTARPRVVCDRSSKLFRDGGYCFLEAVTEGGAAHQLIFDVAPMGYLPNAPHEHADALSVLVRINGTLVLADPGTGTYTGSQAVRDGFRATASHNTVTVDDLDQADVLDTFKWINPTPTCVLDWQSSSDFDYIAALHDGYLRLRRPVVHVREILFVRPDYWIVLDRIIGRGSHRVTSRFHLPPEIGFEQQHDGIFDAVPRGTADGLRLVFPAWRGQPASAVRIERSPWSRGYGAWESSTRLAVEVTGDLPLTLLTLLVPTSSGQSRLEVTALETEAEETPIGERPQEVTLCRLTCPGTPARVDRLVRRCGGPGRIAGTQEIVFIGRTGENEVVRSLGMHGVNRTLGR